MSDNMFKIEVYKNDRCLKHPAENGEYKTKLY